MGLDGFGWVWMGLDGFGWVWMGSDGFAVWGLVPGLSPIHAFCLHAGFEVWWRVAAHRPVGHLTLNPKTLNP